MMVTSSKSSGESSHALRTLGAGVARNKEIMKPVRILILVLNKLNCSWI